MILLIYIFTCLLSHCLDLQLSARVMQFITWYRSVYLPSYTTTSTSGRSVTLFSAYGFAASPFYLSVPACLCGTDTQQAGWSVSYNSNKLLTLCLFFFMASPTVHVPKRVLPLVIELSMVGSKPYLQLTSADMCLSRKLDMALRMQSAILSSLTMTSVCLLIYHLCTSMFTSSPSSFSPLSSLSDTLLGMHHHVSSKHSCLGMHLAHLSHPTPRSTSPLQTRKASRAHLLSLPTIPCGARPIGRIWSK